MDKNQGYEIIKAVMLENGRGFALGHHPTAPSPYVLSLIHIFYTIATQRIEQARLAMAGGGKGE